MNVTLPKDYPLLPGRRDFLTLASAAIGGLVVPTWIIDRKKRFSEGSPGMRCYLIDDTGTVIAATTIDNGRWVRSEDKLDFVVPGNIEFGDAHEDAYLAGVSYWYRSQITNELTLTTLDLPQLFIPAGVSIALEPVCNGKIVNEYAAI